MVFVFVLCLGWFIGFEGLIMSFVAQADLELPAVLIQPPE